MGMGYETKVRKCHKRKKSYLIFPIFQFFLSLQRGSLRQSKTEISLKIRKTLTTRSSLHCLRTFMIGVKREHSLF